MARASYSYALMSLSNQVVIDINQDPLFIIEKDFNGLYSGELGISSITGGQSAANAMLAKSSAALVC